jgi:hypothetical protein
LASSVTARRVQRAVEVLYQTAAKADKRQTGRAGKIAKISEIIFSGLLRSRRERERAEASHAYNPA